MSHLFLDGFLAIIIILGVIIGIKRGAVKIIFSLLAFLFAAYLAYFLATPSAVFINRKFIVPSISQDIYESVDSGENPSSVLPDYITENAAKLGINLDDIRINSSADKDKVSDFVDTHFSPLIVSVISTLLILILFILFSVIFNLFVRILNKLVRHSFVGGINTLLGAVFGALNGCVIVAVLCLILSLTLKNSVNLPFNISEEAVESSLFYSIFLYIF